MRIFQVDAFTGAVFAGNPAGVCLLDAPAENGWMQQVAAEMNLAATAFVAAGPAGYRIRWFSPFAELALCGHGTLASAHVLYETGAAPAGEPVVFESAGGQLTARQENGQILLDFPARPAGPAPPPPGMLAALGVQEPAAVGRPAPGLVWSGQAGDDWLIVLAAEEDVTGLRPDTGGLAPTSPRGIIVTAPARRPGADFVSRFFAPAIGIPEDPVTGSAHCTLAPYWCDRLGRSELTGYQASGRGGTVRVQLAGDRVILAGQAVTVLAGQLSTAAGGGGQRPTA